MKRNIISDNTAGLGVVEGGGKGYQGSSSYPTSKRITKIQQRKIFLFSLQSTPVNLKNQTFHLPFFQARTVPGQRSLSEKIIATNCQKDQYKVWCSNQVQTGQPSVLHEVCCHLINGVDGQSTQWERHEGQDLAWRDRGIHGLRTTKNAQYAKFIKGYNVETLQYDQLQILNTHAAY